jgi:membrane protein YdbS with pleckstrin-like domain
MKSDKLVGEHRPSAQLKKLFYSYMGGILLIAFLSWYIPLWLLAPFGALVVSFFVLPPVLILLLAGLYWIPKFCDSIVYKFTGDEMTWHRGVWFRNTGIVPYNRITNVDVIQGPVSRKLGIASLKIQTAGYSGSTTRTSEITVEGMENFREIQEMIMEYVRGRRPMAVATYEAGQGKSEGPDHADNVLAELVKIRKLLEKK